MAHPFGYSQQATTAPAWPSRRLILPLGLVVLVLILGVVALRFVFSRGGPPRDLTPAEAVALACFQGWTVGGTPAYVPDPREAFVAELAPRDARSFLRQQGATADWPSAGLGEFTGRTLIAVVRGTVTDGPQSDAPARGEGLVLVADADGIVRLAAVGPPWDTVVPPGAQPLPAPDAPRLADVSRARARIELGEQPLVELASPPGGLVLGKITINRERLPVDPTGTAYPGRSVTLSYVAPSGRPRLWITQPTSAGEPRILGRPIPLAALGGGVTPYAWYAGSWEVVGFTWQRGGRSLFLTAEPGPDLSVEEITRTVLALAGPVATPTSSPR